MRPARSSFTWNRDEAVNLRMEAEGKAAREPETVIEVFSKTVEKYPNNIAMIQNVNNSVDVYTYKQYYHNVIYVSKVFIQLGLEPFGGVAIIGFNSPQWFISHLATIFAGGLSVGVYATNSKETCHYILNQSQCNLAVVEDEAQLNKILAIRPQLPSLKAIIVYSGEITQGIKDVYKWEEIFKIETTEDVLNRRIRNIYPNQCCCLVYTSGTTGVPKGAMLSHDNITWTVHTTLEFSNNNQRLPADVFVSYLPLSHVAGLLFDIYLPLATGGGTVYFADRNALQGTLFKTMKEAKPTHFLGVPRVWEKVKEVIEKKLENTNIFKKGVIAWAQDVGVVASVDSSYGIDKPIGYDLAHSLVFEELREALGLERCKRVMVGASPLKKDVSQFFNSIGMPLLGIYGMTECTGPLTFSMPHSYRIGSNGKVVPGMKGKIEKREQSQKIDGFQEGEICIQGRNVFMGYLHNEQQTKDSFDADEYLLSGDLGYFDKDGFLIVSGRIKELIITSGGENIAPLPIEQRMLKKFHAFNNCIVIGEEKKFLSILFTFKVEASENSLEPSNKLSITVIEWLRSFGVRTDTVDEAIKHLNKKTMVEIDEGIEEVNEMATSRAQTIKKWAILPKDFSIGTGELGPTMKLRRKIVAKMYKDIIDDLYK